MSTPSPAERPDISPFDPARFRTNASTLPEPIEPIEPIELALPVSAKQVDCRWSTERFSAPLHLSPTTAPFATVAIAHAGQATITIPEGEARAAEANISLLGLELNALVLPAEFDLFAKRWQLFEGYVWAQPSAELEWKRATEGRVEVALRLPARVTSAHTPPRGQVRCSDLALELTSESEPPVAVIGQKAAHAVWVPWRPGKRVPLSRSPGGPVVAWIDTRPNAASEDESLAENELQSENESESAEPEEAIVFERRGAFARIAYRLEKWIVVGWVPLIALEHTSEPLELILLNGYVPDWSTPITPYGADDPAPRELAPLHHLCAWNAPLAVEVEGSLRRVGMLASGIPLLTKRFQGGLREVTFAHPALEMNDSARFWVPENLLYPCDLAR